MLRKGVCGGRALMGFGGKVLWRRTAFTSAQRALLEEEKTFLDGLAAVVEKAEGSEAERRTVREARQQLDELFLVVVVGEFNSGKSTLINALLGKRLLADGVTPTTAQINIVKYDDGQSHTGEDGVYLSQGIAVHRFGVPWLRDINVVDTPGTNAVFSEHQQLTEQFLPRSDLVLFVTSADRPFSASERQILELIKGWRRKLVMVVNKVDALESAKEEATVMDFVRTNTQQLVGSVDQTVPVFGVAARKHLRSIMDGSQTGEPGFERLKEFILNSLSDGERAVIKLRSPLGMVAKVLATLSSKVDHEASVVAQDAKLLAQMEEENAEWKKKFVAELQQQQTALDNVLLRLEQRAMKFLEENVALSNIVALLMRREEIKRRFETSVMGQLDRDVEKQLAATAEWMTERGKAQLRRTSQVLGSRAGEQEQLVLRGELAASLADSGARAVAAFERNELAASLSTALREAAVQVTALELGALGLAGVLTAALADVTGLLGAGAVAGLGLVVLPYRKREQQARLHTLLADLRARLAEDLQAHLDRHALAVEAQATAAAQPFAAYVHARTKAMSEARRGLTEAHTKASELNAALAKM